MLVFVGSATEGAPNGVPARGAGISAFRLEPDTGALTLLSVQEGITNPCFLARPPERAVIYAVSEVEDWRKSRLTAFALEPETGKLTPINEQPTFGSATCFCALDRSGRFIAVANYSVGTPSEARPQFALFPVGPDGSLGPASFTATLTGSGPLDRQEQPHGHWVGFTPDHRFLLGVDLGADRILAYPFDAQTGCVDQAGLRISAAAPGSTPRHLVFHPGGRWAYVINEAISTIDRLDFDVAAGLFRPTGLVSTLPADWSGASDCSDLAITPDGRFLFAGNRGHDSIAVFRSEPSDGSLALVEHQTGHGVRPRHLAVSPDGRLLLAAFQDSGGLAVFSIDPDKGVLRHRQTCPVGTPMCVVFG